MKTFKVGLSECNFVPTDIKYKIESKYFYIEAEGEHKGEKCKIFGNLPRQEILEMTKDTKENKHLLKAYRKEADNFMKRYLKDQDEDALRQSQNFVNKIKEFVYITKITKEKPRHTYHEVFIKHAKKIKHGIKVEEAIKHLEGGKWKKLNKKLKPNVKFDKEKFKKFKRL